MPPVSREISEKVRIASSGPSVRGNGNSSKFSEETEILADGAELLSLRTREPVSGLPAELGANSPTHVPESSVSSLRLLDLKSCSVAGLSGPSARESASVYSIATPPFFKRRPATSTAAFEDSGQSSPPVATRPLITV